MIFRNSLREYEADLLRFQSKEQEARNCLKEEKKKMNSTLSQCKEMAPLFDDNNNPLPLKAQLEALEVETIDEAVAAVEEAEVKVNLIDENPDVLRLYESLKLEIAQLRQDLENQTDSKDAQIAEIMRHREPWVDALENSLQKVNRLFGGYMAELGCAGQIVLTRGNTETRSSQTDNGLNDKFDFANWGIEIQVKFREKSKMSVLSAQRHSGGERSVSTIMYLMSLQELMVSPFRCVDEINQGLDERNERLVFRRIVQNSTKPPERGDLTSHSGQYFLITPKLLPNLTAMEEEAVTVHIITNGPYTFTSSLDWNPDSFVSIRKRPLEEGVDENDSSAIQSEHIPFNKIGKKKKRK
jgi:structural maintenance of chromosomes protein 5